MTLIIQPGAAGKVGIFHAQLGGLLVHQLHKGFLAARYIFRQAHGSVIGALHRYRLQQVVHRHLLAGLQPYLAAAKARSRLAAGHGIGQGYFAAVQRLHKEQQAHDLGDGGRGQLFISVHLVPHGAGVLVDENSAFDRQRKCHLHSFGLGHLLLNHRRRDIGIGDLLPGGFLGAHGHGKQQPRQSCRQQLFYPFHHMTSLLIRFIPFLCGEGEEFAGGARRRGVLFFMEKQPHAG